MKFEVSRLRRGEVLAGGAAALLAVAMFAMPWYGVPSPFAQELALSGHPTSWDGWNGLSHLRWLLLLTILAALGLVWLQATRRAPALPVTFSMIVTVLGLVTTVALIYRVLIDTPGAASHLERRYGGFVGLAASALMFYAGYLSMRREGVSERDEHKQIETVSLRDAPPRQPAHS